MPVAIRNLTTRPMFVPLNSGRNIRLSPRAVSASLNDVEVKNNPTIDKLCGKRIIAVETLKTPDPEASAVAPATKPAAPAAEPAHLEATPQVKENVAPADVAQPQPPKK